MLPKIDDPVAFMDDHGILFELNRQVLHPLGMELRIQGGESPGSATLELLDNRDNPELICFSPEAFDKGRERYEAYLASTGRRNIQKRRHLGMVIQTGPDAALSFAGGAGSTVESTGGDR